MTSARTFSMNDLILFHKKISQSERTLAYSYVINENDFDLDLIKFQIKTI